MPLYDAICLNCQHEHEYVQTMDKRDRAPKCPQCGFRSEKFIKQSPAVYGDLNDFSLENSGKGRWNHQLRQHVTSVKDAEFKASKRGWEVMGK